MDIQISNKREKTVLVLAVTLITFGIGFFTAPFILQSIYGFESNASIGAGLKIPVVVELSTPYNETINITMDAANQTEGYAVDNYIQNVKDDICSTLVSAEEYDHCMTL